MQDRVVVTTDHQPIGSDDL